MGLNVLTSLLRINAKFELKGNFCSSFEPSVNMLSCDPLICANARGIQEGQVEEESEIMETLV